MVSLREQAKERQGVLLEARALPIRNGEHSSLPLPADDLFFIGQGLIHHGTHLLRIAGRDPADGNLWPQVVIQLAEKNIAGGLPAVHGLHQKGRQPVGFGRGQVPAGIIRGIAYQQEISRSWSPGRCRVGHEILDGLGLWHTVAELIVDRL